MIFINEEHLKGRFTDSNDTIYSYRQFDKNSIDDRMIILEYMLIENNYRYYNDGELQDFHTKINDGFYDNSFVITDERGRLNSIVIYYLDIVGDNEEVLFASILFLNNKRLRVPLDFVLSYFNRYLDFEYFIYDTKLNFINDYFKNKHGYRFDNERSYVIQNDSLTTVKFL